MSWLRQEGHYAHTKAHFCVMFIPITSDTKVCSKHLSSGFSCGMKRLSDLPASLQNVTLQIEHHYSHCFTSRLKWGRLGMIARPFCLGISNSVVFLERWYQHLCTPSRTHLDLRLYEVMLNTKSSIVTSFPILGWVKGITVLLGIGPSCMFALFTSVSFQMADLISVFNHHKLMALIF